jgi:DNA adenine methylase
MAAPVLKWPGSKFMIAPWIIEHMPPHKVYCEPFFGAGAVLFHKERSAAEIVNDRSGAVVNLFRVIRDDTEALCRAVALTPWAREEYEFCTSYRGEEEEPVEWARRFLVGCWQQIGQRYGTVKGSWTGGWRTSQMSNCDPAVTWLGLPRRIIVAAQRLQGVNIENRPALDVIRRFDSLDVLHYVDPPYVLSVRDRSMYEHEMSDADHVELLETLDRHPGPALVSGYWCDLYAERLSHWRCVRRRAYAQSNGLREECLWLNPVAAGRLGQPRLIEEA